MAINQEYLVKKLDYLLMIVGDITREIKDIQKNIELSNKGTTNNLEDFDKKKANDNLVSAGLIAYNDKMEWIAKFTGPSNLFLDYLSSDIIRTGKGSIESSETFKQYDDDISRLSTNRLSKWPSGFYRSDISKDIQLLLFNENYIFCIDNLPSYNLDVKVAIAPFTDTTRLIGVEYMSKEQFPSMVENLITILDNIKLHHNLNKE